jgi:transcriptional regulator with XRE-family HTH domain
VDVATALKEARLRNGLSQENVASEIHYSRQLVQAVEQKRRRLPREIRPKLARSLDSAKLYLALANEATGGVMVGTWDEDIEAHRLVAREWLLKEMDEAEEAMRKTWALAKKPEQLAPEEREQIIRVLKKTKKVIDRGLQAVAVIAESYGISLAELWREAC